MGDSKKTIFAALMLAAVLMLPLLQVPSIFAVDLNGKEKTLAFLSDVALLDLTKYNITLRDYDVSYPPEYGGIAKEWVRYILETSDSKLDANIIFLNGTYGWSLLFWDKGSPIYIQPQPVSVIDSAKGVIERYQAYSGYSGFQEMRAMLDTINTVENTTVISQDQQIPAKVLVVGNLKLEVIFGNTVSFLWTYTFTDFEMNALSIDFRKDALYGIDDRWRTVFTVGSTEATVTEEEAISIAMNRAQNFSYVANGTTVSGFTVRFANATLSMNARDPLTLYPFWRVDLWLDKYYPGGVSSIAVGIWADTGEVSYIQELSYGGGSPPSSPTPSSTPDPTSPPPSQPGPTTTPSQTENSSAPPTGTILVASAAAATVAFAVAALALKKRRR